MSVRSLYLGRNPGPLGTLARSLVVLVPVAFLAGCNDDDDSDDGGPVPPQQTAFSAFLDESEQTPAPVEGTRVRVTVANRAPEMGTLQAALWVAFHDGTFELFDVGSSADAFFPLTRALERLAEDADPGPLGDDFDASAAGLNQRVIDGELAQVLGPLAPGETVSVVFELDPMSAQNRFFSYASMVAPSNDAFVANDDPMAHEIYDAAGNFVATNFTVTGAEVLDAGTEVNDEDPANTGFFGQPTPDSGTAEGGVVALHAGFLAAGSGGILDDPEFAQADFTADGYQVLSFSFEELPAGPPSMGVSAVQLANGDATVVFDVAATGLSGPVTQAHLHSGAAGVVGPVLIDLGGSVVEDEDGTVRVEGALPATPELVTALRAGTVYVDLHTGLNPLGELRGQVTTDEAFLATVDTAQEVPAPVLGTALRVTVRNRAPAMGTFQGPVWIGLHDGTFDLYDLGSSADLFFPATMALERLAEDAHTDQLLDDLETSLPDSTGAALMGAFFGGPIAPGEAVSRVFRVDPTSPDHRFLSFATQILPSNDAFLANDDPMAHPVFDGTGAFVGTDFAVVASEALDAGTEQNDEVPANTAFFGQTVPNTGTAEDGVVALHPGFLEAGMGGILDDPMFAAADFAATPGYEFLAFELGTSTPATLPSGLVAVRLNQAETELRFSVSASDLSGPALAMHFHEALPGVAGPIVIDLTATIENVGDGKMFATGTVPIDGAFLGALRAGRIYLNIHTELNPTGEIRGQVLLVGQSLTIVGQVFSGE